MLRPAAWPALAAAAALLAAAAPAAASPRTACDPFGDAPCAMPFPNDMNLTVRDDATPTGLRVRLPRAALPPDRAGVTPDPAEWNRADGFSPGQLVAVHVPGLSSARAARRSGLTPVTALGRFRRRRASLVVLDAETRERQPVWAEVDVRDAPVGPRLLLVHPARNLVAGRRYIVVLRNLRRASGRRIAAPRSFRRILDGAGPRRFRARYAGILRTLAQAGIGRRGLYLAWDFTVASRRSTQSRLLRLRDDVFAQLGDTELADGVVSGRPPAFSVNAVAETPGDPRIARQVTGTFEVPCYLDKPGCPAAGARLRYPSGDPDALPAQEAGNVHRARFDCIVPRSALTTPARLLLHGHGLLGSGERIVAGENVRAMAADHGFVTCATDWFGLSAADQRPLAQAWSDLGRFGPSVDRQLQGMLGPLLLGRLMLHPRGLASDRAFRAGGRPVVDLGDLFYDGNSIGGIMGTTLAAIAPDFRRATLGVPGINFSTLLYRMASWASLGDGFDRTYPDRGDRVLALGLMQMLWDRSEPSGWAANVTRDPPPDTPAKAVLLHVAVGDWSVPTWQADALARTLGAFARRPAIAPGRTLERSPLHGIPAIPAFPFAGSAIVYWDAGRDFTGVTPAAAVPASSGSNPHYVPRQTPAAQRQKSEFLRPDGAVVEVCDPGRPCEGADAPAP